MSLRRVALFASRAFVALILLGSLGLQTLSLNAQAGEEIVLQDGWTFLNHPPVVNQVQKLQGLWTIGVETLPLFDLKVSEKNSMATHFNHYYDITFSPDPNFFEFTGELKQYEEKQTPNFVRNPLIVSDEVYQKYVAQLKKETGKKQQIKNGFKTFGTTLLNIPVFVLAIAMFPVPPLWVASIMTFGQGMENIQSPAYNRNLKLSNQQKLLSRLQRQHLLSRLTVDILPHLQKINDLQQNYSDASKNKSLTSYHVLPTSRNYGIDFKKKTIRYGYLAETMTFELKLKEPMLLDTFKNLLAQQFKLNPQNTFKFDSYVSYSSNEGLESNEKYVKKYYVSSCSLGLKPDLKSFNLECLGFSK
jgi:hypothetical protein